MGILQTRILEWVAMSSSRGSSQLKSYVSCIGQVGFFFTMNTTWEAWKGILKVSKGKIHLCIRKSVLPIIITLPLMIGNIIKLPLRDVAKRSDLDIKFTKQLKLLEEEVIVLESY